MSNYDACICRDKFGKPLVGNPDRKVTIDKSSKKAFSITRNVKTSIRQILEGLEE